MHREDQILLPFTIYIFNRLFLILTEFLLLFFETFTSIPILWQALSTPPPQTFFGTGPSRM
jgi:hypothetical protein